MRVIVAVPNHAIRYLRSGYRAFQWELRAQRQQQSTQVVASSWVVAARTWVAQVLAYVKEHADSADRQQRVLAALRFKCDVLWAQLDALYFAYVSPRLAPPGVFLPEGS